MSKMYKILLNMKGHFSDDGYRALVEQAYSKDKITEDEMNELCGSETTEEKE